MVNEVASKTSDNAGDGTTTATVLAQAIFREGLKNVTAGANPMDIKRGIEDAVELIVDEIHKQAKPTKDKKKLHRSAPSPLTTTRQSVTSSPKRWTRLVKTVLSRLKKPKVWKRLWKSLKVCSSTAVTSPHTLLPMLSAWKLSAKTLISCSTKRNSPT